MEKIILTNMCLIENPKTNEVVVIHRVKTGRESPFLEDILKKGKRLYHQLSEKLKKRPI